MRRRTRIVWLVTGALVLFGGIGLHLAREPIGRAVTMGLLEEITGFGVELAGLEVRLGRRTLAFTDLKLLNPPPFTEPEAVHLSRVQAELTWDALLGRRTRLKRLDLEIAALTLVRPRDGVSNLEVLGQNAAAWGMAAEPPPEARAVPAVAGAGWGMPRRPRQAELARPTDHTPDLQIDELRIRLGTVHLVDYRLGRTEPVRFSSEVNREKTYRDVTDLAALGEELAIDFGVDAILGQFSEIDETFPGLSDDLKDFIRRANTPGSEEARQVEEALGQFQDALDGFFN